MNTETMRSLVVRSAGPPSCTPHRSPQSTRRPLVAWRTRSTLSRVRPGGGSLGPRNCSCGGGSRRDRHRSNCTRRWALPRECCPEVGGVYWCYHCYGVNSLPAGTCVHCGRPIEEPGGLTQTTRLVWALGHPDGDRALVAARRLGLIRAREAVPALWESVRRSHDPYDKAVRQEVSPATAGAGGQP